MFKLLRCRRGSVAFATVVIALPLMGVIALGGEAATWYSIKQHAQNAADAAAYSGALRLACSLGAIPCTDNPGSCSDETSCVSYRAKQYAAKNSFCDGSSTTFPGCPVVSGRTSQSVQVDIGTYAAPTWTTESGSFVRAIVTQTQPAYLAALLNLTNVDIAAQAIAKVENPRELCSLGLGGSLGQGSPSSALVFGGNVSFGGTGCGLMSDNSVNYNSVPTFPTPATNWAVEAVNGCDKSSVASCTGPGVPYNYYMPTATNPLSVLDSQTFNSASGRTSKACGGTVTTNQSCALTPNSPSSLYGDFKVTGGTVTLASGTYFFYNAAITINSGSVTGTNVNLVLLGNSSISITGGTVNLSANFNNTTYPALDGVLIDDQAPHRASNSVTINGGSSTTLALGGAMYFPNVDLTYGGTTQNANTACTEVIADTITMEGSAYLSTSGCAAGTVARTQVVALVQ